MNPKGFSLFEILIAVSILASMALMMQLATTRVLTSKQKVEKRDELLHGASATLSRLTTDLSQAFLLNQRLKGDNNKIETGMKGSGDKIDFTSMGHFHYIKNAKDTDQVSLGYELKRNDRGVYDLFRRESQRLGEKIDEGGRSFLLLQHVKELKFQYYDSLKEDWQNECDTQSLSWQNRLPQAVKIELRLVDFKNDEDEKGREYYFSTVVAIPLYAHEINF